MLKPRVIPVLLIKNGKLVKTVKFKKDQYIGDPINAIKIFSEKDVDELIILDISEDRHSKGPDYDFLEKALSQCFMPVSYGGGISTLEQVKKIIHLGTEKIILNSMFYQDMNLTKNVVQVFGSQAVSVSLDIRRKFLGGYDLYSHGGTKKIRSTLKTVLDDIKLAGAGEIFINHIDRDGTMMGYDLNLIELIAKNTHLPVIACGGASCKEDFQAALDSGAHSVAAGSMFVFQGPHRAVLIQYDSL